MNFSRPLFGLLLIPFVSLAIPRELRDKNVVYFDKTLPAPVVLKLEKGVNGYLDKTLSSVISVFYAGSDVTALAYDPAGKSLLLEGTYRGQPAEGWVPLSEIKPVIDPKLLEAAIQRKEELKAIQQAIKEKIVIKGMEFTHVEQALGKPEGFSNRIDQRGRVDIWNFIKYDKIYQKQLAYDVYGRPYYRSVAVRVPIGEIKVEFVDGLVVAIEEHRTGGNLTPPGLRTNN